MTMRLVRAPAVVLVALVLACGSAGPGAAHGVETVAGVFGAPAPYPGRAWTRDGVEVPPSEIVAAAGPEHCGWQSATFLTLGWPLGTRPQTAAGARQYVRDPRHVLGSRLPALELDATLPADASPTGYAYGAVWLYLAPSDQDQAVYMVLGDNVERWPRSDPMTLCS
jgi:hypothetical protein